MSTSASITSLAEYRERRRATDAGQVVVHPIPLRADGVGIEACARMMRNPGAIFVVATRPQLLQPPDSPMGELVSALRARFAGSLWVPVLRPWLDGFEPRTRRRWEQELVEHLKVTFHLLAISMAAQVFGPIPGRLFVIGPVEAIIRLHIAAYHQRQSPLADDGDQEGLPSPPYLVPFEVTLAEERFAAYVNHLHLSLFLPEAYPKRIRRAPRRPFWWPRRRTRRFTDRDQLAYELLMADFNSMLRLRTTASSEGRSFDKEDLCWPV